MLKKKYKCPICKKPIRNGDMPYFPFCSERCKLVDLEACLGGRYFVPGERVDVDGEREKGIEESENE